MTIVVDSSTCLDAVDLSCADFYRSLRAGSASHTTASPAVGDYLRAFEATRADVLLRFLSL